MKPTRTTTSLAFFHGLLALGLVACGSTGTASDAGAEVVPYPLDTCVVMDSKLGSMGDPVTIVYEGREVKFCCEACVAEFERTPEVFLAKIDEAQAAQD